MNPDRLRILKMLAEGKVSAEEADRLLDALGAEPARALPAAGPRRAISACWSTPLTRMVPPRSMSGCRCSFCGRA